MKRFWLVLLSAALVLAFAMSASAQTTARFSGSYYVHGYYNDNNALRKDNTVAAAFYAQRFRLGTVFTVAPGLTVTTRLDAKEMVWGAERSAAPTNRQRGSGTPWTVEDENIGVDQTFVTFDTKAGRFMVGYQPAMTWGTVFGNAATTHARISYFLPRGPWTFSAIFEKQQEMEVTPTASATGGYSGMTIHGTDRDSDVYYLSATYRQKTWEAGLLYAHANNATATTSRGKSQSLHPYFRGTFGKLSLEAELGMGFGKVREGIGAVTDIDDAGLRYYVSASYAMGPLRVGALYAFAQGDDPNTDGKNEGTLNGGSDFDPNLLLYNSFVGVRWSGPMGTNLTTNDTMSNASLWQVNLGYAVSKDLSVAASFSQANVNQKAVTKTTSLVSDNIGQEFNLSANYKIFGNLDYMLGFAYFWAGDAYKGTSAANTIGNNYLVFHRLTVTF